VTNGFIVIARISTRRGFIRRPSPRLVEDDGGAPAIGFVDEHRSSAAAHPRRGPAHQEYEEGRVQARPCAVSSRAGRRGSRCRLPAPDGVRADRESRCIPTSTSTKYSHKLPEQIERCSISSGSSAPSHPSVVDRFSNQEIIQAGLDARRATAARPC